LGTKSSGKYRVTFCFGYPVQISLKVLLSNFTLNEMKLF